MKLFALALVMVGSIVAVQDDVQPRTWSDDSGAFTFTGTMIVDAGEKLTDNVRLTNDKGQIVTVAINRLDDESQRYVRKLRRAAKSRQNTNLKTVSVSGDDSATAVAFDDWNWRGPNRDGVSTESGLMADWSTTKPKLLWTADGIGKAMSSVSIGDGKIFTMGNRDGGEQLIALNPDDGKELWAAKVGTGGSSNCTPTVDGELVFAIGRAGDLVCANAKTGDVVWRKNFARDFAGKMMSGWGYSESPLVDGDLVIVTPGGPQAIIAALDKRTGKTVWQTPMPYGGKRGADGAGYSSVVIGNGGGTKQYITLVGRGLVSVSATDGKPLWHYEKIANGTANVPTPIVDGDYVFCSSGYGDGGSALLKLSGRNGKVNFQEVYYLSANELQNHHGGMVKIGDYVYMGEGHNQGFPMCVEFKTGRKLWKKQRGAGTGSAAIVAADDHLYFRYQNGVMALIEANPKKYNLKGSFRIASVHGESWPHPVIFDGKLYLRDQHQLHCYDIVAKP